MKMRYMILKYYHIVNHRGINTYISRSQETKFIGHQDITYKRHRAYEKNIGHTVA